MYMSGLRCIVGDQLDSIIDRSKLGFGGLVKDDELLGRAVDVLESMAGRSKSMN